MSAHLDAIQDGLMDGLCADKTALTTGQNLLEESYRYLKLNVRVVNGIGPDLKPAHTAVPKIRIRVSTFILTSWQKSVDRLISSVAGCRGCGKIPSTINWFTKIVLQKS